MGGQIFDRFRTQAGKQIDQNYLLSTRDKIDVGVIISMGTPLVDNLRPWNSRITKINERKFYILDLGAQHYYPFFYPYCLPTWQHAIYVGTNFVAEHPYFCGSKSTWACGIHPRQFNDRYRQSFR